MDLEKNHGSITEYLIEFKKISVRARCGSGVLSGAFPYDIISPVDLSIQPGVHEIRPEDHACWCAVQKVNRRIRSLITRPDGSKGWQAELNVLHRKPRTLAIRTIIYLSMQVS
jgi:hypothetical protein